MCGASILVSVRVIARPSYFFFFNDTATTEIYTLSLHDALPICGFEVAVTERSDDNGSHPIVRPGDRSEKHTSELQSPDHLVCPLLLEKKKKSLPFRHPSYIRSPSLMTISVASTSYRCVPYSAAP